MHLTSAVTKATRPSRPQLHRPGFSEKPKAAPRRDGLELVEFEGESALTLSSERPAEVQSEEEAADLQTHTHLTEILKCIVDKKTWKTLVL